MILIKLWFNQGHKNVLWDERKTKQNDVGVMKRKMHSPLDGLCRASSLWWPEHHSVGWLPPCICSDPWGTDTHQQSQMHRLTHKHTKRGHLKLWRQFPLIAHYFQVTRSKEFCTSSHSQCDSLWTTSGASPSFLQGNHIESPGSLFNG